MREMIGAAIAVFLFAACPMGCTEKPGPLPGVDAEFPRLAAGDEAISYDEHEDKAPIYDIPKGRGVAPGSSVNFVAVGAKVRVIEDVEPDREGFSGKDRHVRIVPLEGEMEGVAGVMFRENLKAVGAR